MTQIDILKIRRDEIKQIVIETLQHGNACHLPLKIKYITRSFSNIRLISFSKQMKRLNLSYKQMITFAESKDACTDYYADINLYYIYYNDIDSNIVNSNRYRWNIAHELGHVLLRHHINYQKTRIFRSSLTDYEYDILENEADYFTQLILVPHVPLYAFNITEKNNIMYLCQISGPASYKRFIAYFQWKKHIEQLDFFDNAMFNLYYKYIYQKKCNNCGASLIQKHKYCPICGKKSLQWGESKMKYLKIEAYPNGKLKICPICKNEETEIEGDFCQICNIYLVNECQNSSCEGYEQMLPTNARYCPVCGRESLFLNNDILKRWNYYDDCFFNIPDSVENEMGIEIPDGVEEEGLPFN